MEEYLTETNDNDTINHDWGHMTDDEFHKIKFKNVTWKQDYIKLFGKTHPLPRLTSWYGDPGASYSYSGIHSDPNPWNDGLNFVRRKIEDAIGCHFNCVLLNWYRSGNDSLSWHADDEKELGKDPVIASANFGCRRDFQLRKKGNAKEHLTVDLGPGSLLVMKGALQENWEHQVPKRKRTRGSRFNLTFRYIHPNH